MPILPAFKKMELNLVHYVWSNKYFSGYKILYYYFIELCGHKREKKEKRDPRGKRKAHDPTAACAQHSSIIIFNI